MIEASLHEFLASVWYVLLWVMLTAHLVSHAIGLGAGITAGFREGGTSDTPPELRLGPFGTAWLALLVCGLFGAFPLAFERLLEYATLPIAVLGTALGVRAFALRAERRERDASRWWPVVGLASTTAAAAQGWIFGAVLQGLTAPGHRLLAAHFAWLSLYSTAAAGSIVLGYTTVGATYLLRRAGGGLAEHARRVARRSGGLSLLLAPVIILWSNAGPLREYANGWLIAIGALGIPAALAMVLRRLAPAARGSPLPWAIACVLIAALLLGVELYPFVLPHAITAFGAAASNQRLILLTVIFGLLIPSLLSYNVYRYLARENGPDR